MKDLFTKNVAYIGLLSGLVVALICLLTPPARDVVVWYQLFAVIVFGGTIGYTFRNKIENSMAVPILGKCVEYFTDNHILFKALHDGEGIVIDGDDERIEA